MVTLLTFNNVAIKVAAKESLGALDTPPTKKNAVSKIKSGLQRFTA
jgi:hypothetical protein